MKKFRICFNGKLFGIYDGKDDTEAIYNCLDSAEYKRWAKAMIDSGHSDVQFSVMEIPVLGGVK